MIEFPKYKVGFEKKKNQQDMLNNYIVNMESKL